MAEPETGTIKEVDGDHIDKGVLSINDFAEKIDQTSYAGIEVDDVKNKVKTIWYVTGHSPVWTM